MVFPLFSFSLLVFLTFDFRHYWIETEDSQT